MKSRSPHSALLALSLIPGLGNHRIGKLLTVFDDPFQVFDADVEELLRIEGIGPVTARQIQDFNDWDRVEMSLSRTTRCHSSLVSILDSSYPDTLKELYDAPPLLWIKGSVDCLSEPGIAVVGTRRPDRYGLDQAGKWADQISRSGLSVISGLAYGIDTVAHKSAVNNRSHTVAVMGSGIDTVYPSSNRKLAAAILDTGGALITEFPPGTHPEPQNFPRRNRLVSGLSLGVLMIQSGIRGGSMITARCALDQNREVFIIPHSLDSPSGAGGNELIKRGEGKLVRTFEDLTVELTFALALSSPDVEPHSVNTAPIAKPEDLSGVQPDIYHVLENGPVHIDELSKEVDIERGQLLPALLEMELKGFIRQLSGKYFELA